MSAFAVVFERSNIPVEIEVLECVMQRLEHRGPDGCDVWVSGNVAMGHWHFWTTPEEVGERQPLKITGLPLWIVFDGRLDNRDELIRNLRLTGEEIQVSDAILVLRSYDKWGGHCAEHFIGEYAFVILDESRSKFFCARDPLGDRSLFYTIKGTRVLIASEPWALTDSATEPNENAIAHFFALRASEDGETLFKGVFELPPAHVMTFSPAGEQNWCYWQPDLSKTLRGKSDREYAEGFLALLEESVRCRLRSNVPVAVMMSGGLDSTSVACLTARMVAPHPLTTISYIFDEFPECDERRYIETIKTKYGIHSIQVPCDALLPYQEVEKFPHNPNGPDGNIYRMIIERTYRRAAEAGLRVLLTGTYGDELYCGAEDWLAALLTEKRLRNAAQDMKLHIRYAGLHCTLKSAFMRRAVIRLLESLPGGARLVGTIRNWRKASRAEWLTPFAANCITPTVHPKESLLGILTAEDNITDAYYAGRYALELRHPYRDRRLVEYVLSLPGHQFYRHGRYKHVLRVAMQGILPEIIRNRTIPTTLLAILARSLNQNGQVLNTCIRDSEASWSQYVRAEWLERHWNAPVTIENDGAWAVIPWLCASYATWHSTLFDRRVDYVRQDLILR